MEGKNRGVPGTIILLLGTLGGSSNICHKEAFYIVLLLIKISQLNTFHILGTSCSND